MKALVTGASRGIGAATAVKLAERGWDVAINFRDKRPRAEAVAQQVMSLGRKALLAKADLTIESDIAAMMAEVVHGLGALDALVLNASGGLEANKPEDYAMTLNLTAQMNTAKAATALLQPGARIVFVTSHWAHFYGSKRIMPVYEPVAKSKRAGEDALREYSKDLARRDVSLVVVSGDAIEGTITPLLLERLGRGTNAPSHAPAQRVLPTVDEFATAIAAATVDRSLASGHTVFVGSTEW